MTKVHLQKKKKNRFKQNPFHLKESTEIQDLQLIAQKILVRFVAITLDVVA
jgi:hypothetical protein